VIIGELFLQKRVQRSILADSDSDDERSDADMQPSVADADSSEMSVDNRPGD